MQKEQIDAEFERLKEVNQRLGAMYQVYKWLSPRLSPEKREEGAALLYSAMEQLENELERWQREYEKSVQLH